MISLPIRFECDNPECSNIKVVYVPLSQIEGVCQHDILRSNLEIRTKLDDEWAWGFDYNEVFCSWDCKQKAGK